MSEGIAVDIDALAAAIGLEFEPARRTHVIRAFTDIAKEIAILRSLDLTDVHPAVVFSPVVSNGSERDAGERRS